MVEVTLDATRLQARLHGFDRAVITAVHSAFDRGRGRAESYMKQNAPWTDQTGNARGGLHASVSRRVTGATMTLAHSVPYGIFLETRWSGKYAVINPTIQNQAPLIQRDVIKVLGALGGVK